MARRGGSLIAASLLAAILTFSGEFPVPRVHVGVLGLTFRFLCRHAHRRESTMHARQRDVFSVLHKLLELQHFVQHAGPHPGTSPHSYLLVCVPVRTLLCGPITT